jgi:Family of unknown function (DUF6232)
MITYYDDRAVKVTSQAIRVAGRSYPLATLSKVWHRRGERSWGTVAGRGAIGVALVVPLIAAGLGIVLALRLHTSTSTTVLIVGGSILVGLAAAPLADFLLGRMDLSYSKGARALEIWAEVGGRPTLLVRTADALKFGQIYRALQRALEAVPRY